MRDSSQDLDEAVEQTSNRGENIPENLALLRHLVFACLTYYVQPAENAKAMNLEYFPVLDPTAL